MACWDDYLLSEAKVIQRDTVVPLIHKEGSRGKKPPYSGVLRSSLGKSHVNETGWFSLLSNLIHPHTVVSYSEVMLKSFFFR